jgi:hypothetical protein
LSDEEWIPIKGMGNYLINNYGSVYNRRLERLMSESRTMQGDYKVTLSEGGVRLTRSVRVLVAEHFVAKPTISPGFHKSAIPDTVIVLDNDKSNLYYRNLAWRPAWFAQKYSRQFKPVYPSEYYSKQILNLQTGEVYSSIIEAGIKEGVLFDDLLTSALQGVAIYPTRSVYCFT